LKRKLSDHKFSQLNFCPIIVAQWKFSMAERVKAPFLRRPCDHDRVV